MKKMFSKLGVLLIAITLIGVSLTACGKKEENTAALATTQSTTAATVESTTATVTESTTEVPKELVKLKLANLAVGLGSAYHELGIEQGIFAKYGIELEVVNFPKGGAEATAGVASGQVDMGSYGTPILTGISKGLPIKIVASPAVKENTFVLVAANDIQSVSDLKGKTVATGALGGGNHQSFLKIIEASGLTEADVSVVATGGTDAFMIIKSGKVAAVNTSEPTVSQIIADGSGHVLAEAKDFYGEYQHSYVFATDEFIKNHPEAISNFLKASRESYEYSKNHFEELVAKGKTLVGFDEAIIREYYTREIAKWDLSFEINFKGAENAVEILKGLEEIDESAVFDKNTWFDLNFLEN